MSLRLLYDATTIATRVKEMGATIAAKYGNEPLVCVCVLKGAMPFFADLVRAIGGEDVRLECVRISSYGNSDTSSGTVNLVQDVEGDIQGQHVLVVEDIVDSGRSMDFLLAHLKAKGARSVRIAALIDKHSRREVDVTVDFAGFVLSDGFLVGYGLDYAERYRALPGVYEVVAD